MDTNAFTTLKGVNYIVATTQVRDHYQAMLSPDDSITSTLLAYPGTSGPRPVPFGQFDPDIVKWELSLLRFLGFDSVRIYGSFTAHLLDRANYEQNLRCILRTCKCLDLKVTFSVWTGGGESPYAQALYAFDFYRYPSRQEIKRAIQLVGDDWHVSRLRFGQNEVSLHGSHFALAPWIDPDVDLPSVHGAPDRWPRFTNLETAIGQTLVQAIDDYLRTLVRVCGDPELRSVFLSYDLFNEPEAWAGVLASLRARDRNTLNPFELRLLDRLSARGSHENMREFIVYTHGRLAAGHRALNHRPHFTVGLAGWESLAEYYLDLIGRFPPLDPPISYASFHENFRQQTDLLRPTFFTDDLDPVRQRIGLPVVCSEFYAPYFTAQIRDSVRGNLGTITQNMQDNKVGGQIWAVLQSNVFDPLTTKGVVDPIDGLFVSVDPPDGVYDPSDMLAFLDPNTPPPVIAPPMSDFHWNRADFNRDVAALALWTRDRFGDFSRVHDCLTMKTSDLCPSGGPA